MIAFRHLRTGVALSAVAALFAAVSCGPSSSEGSTAPIGTTVDVAALLGPTQKASGSAIKIGFVHDGKTMGIDHTAVIGAFNAAVQYANEHRNGINGHPIEVEECSTNNTPSDGTTCGVKLVNDKVAAVLVPVSAQDASLFKALEGSGIPYFTYAAGAQDIITKPDSFLLVNPIGLLAGPAKIAGNDGVKKAGIIIIDVPAASGPVSAIAKPIYAKAGIDLDLILISPQTADMTPQIQQAISSGAEQFSVVGTDEFTTTAINSLKQLGFTGKIVMVTAPTPAMVDGVSGGLEGIATVTSATGDPNDADVQRYDAVMQTYMKDVTPTAQSVWAYATVLGFVDALTGTGSATDASSIADALRSMPSALPLPMGGGLTYRCGAKVVPLLPNVCTANILTTTLDEQGRGQQYTALDVSDYLTPVG